jgi:hypothetical protein
MTRRPLSASRRSPLAVIEPSGYAKIAATARRSGVLSPTSLRAGMWRGFLTSVRPRLCSFGGRNISTGQPKARRCHIGLLEDGRTAHRNHPIQCNTAFLADPAVLLVQTRPNLWDQSVPDRRFTFWSTASQARFKSASGCPETASYSRPVTTRNAESFVPVIFPSDSSRIRPRACQAHRSLASS